MVKIFCNRCGKEIKDHYHTINIYNYDTHPDRNVDFVTAANCATAYSGYRDDALATLNAIEMYCPDCIEAIKEFIYNGEGSV